MFPHSLPFSGLGPSQLPLHGQSPPVPRCSFLPLPVFPVAMSRPGLLGPHPSFQPCFQPQTLAPNLASLHPTLPPQGGGEPCGMYTTCWPPGTHSTVLKDPHPHSSPPTSKVSAAGGKAGEIRAADKLDVTDLFRAKAQRCGITISAPSAQQEQHRRVQFCSSRDRRDSALSDDGPALASHRTLRGSLPGDPHVQGGAGACKMEGRTCAGKESGATREGEQVVFSEGKGSESLQDLLLRPGAEREKFGEEAAVLSLKPGQHQGLLTQDARGRLAAASPNALACLGHCQDYGSGSLSVAHAEKAGAKVGDGAGKLVSDLTRVDGSGFQGMDGLDAIKGAASAQDLKTVNLLGESSIIPHVVDGTGDASTGRAQTMLLLNPSTVEVVPLLELDDQVSSGSSSCADEESPGPASESESPGSGVLEHTGDDSLGKAELEAEERHQLADGLLLNNYKRDGAEGEDHHPLIHCTSVQGVGGSLPQDEGSLHASPALGLSGGGTWAARVEVDGGPLHAEAGVQTVDMRGARDRSINTVISCCHDNVEDRLLARGDNSAVQEPPKPRMRNKASQACRVVRTRNQAVQASIPALDSADTDRMVQLERKLMECQASMCQLRAQACIVEYRRQRQELQVAMEVWTANFLPVDGNHDPVMWALVSEKIAWLDEQIHDTEALLVQCMERLAWSPMDEVPSFSILVPTPGGLTALQPRETCWQQLTWAGKLEVCHSGAGGGGGEKELDAGAEEDVDLCDLREELETEAAGSGRREGKQQDIKARELLDQCKTAKSGCSTQKPDCCRMSFPSRPVTSPACLDKEQGAQALALTVSGMLPSTGEMVSTSGEGSDTVSNSPTSASHNVPQDNDRASHLPSSQAAGIGRDVQALLKADATGSVTKKAHCDASVDRDAVPGLEESFAPPPTSTGVHLKPSKVQHGDIAKSGTPELDAVNYLKSGHHEERAAKKCLSLSKTDREGKLEGLAITPDSTSLPSQGTAAGSRGEVDNLGLGLPSTQLQELCQQTGPRMVLEDPSLASHPSMLGALSLHQAWALVFHGQHGVSGPQAPLLGPMSGLTASLPGLPSMSPTKVQARALSISSVPSSIHGATPLVMDQSITWSQPSSVKTESHEEASCKKGPGSSPTKNGTAAKDVGTQLVPPKSLEASRQGDAKLAAAMAKHSSDQMSGNRPLGTSSMNSLGFSSHQNTTTAPVVLGSSAPGLPHTMMHIQGRSALTKPPPGFDLGRSMVYTGSQHPLLNSAYIMNGTPTFNHFTSTIPRSGPTAKSTSQQKSVIEGMARLTETVEGKATSDSGNSFASDSAQSMERNAGSGRSSPRSASAGLARQQPGVRGRAEAPVSARLGHGGQMEASGVAQQSGTAGPPSSHNPGVAKLPLKPALSKTEGSMARLAEEKVGGSKEKLKKSLSSFEKLIGLLLEELPDAKRDELRELIAQIRESNGNSLSGMKTCRIIEVAVNLYRRKKSLMPPPFADMTAAKKPLSEEEECPICYESLSADPMQVLECGHRFHFKCIKEWIGTYTRTCPTCRNHTLLPDEFPLLT